MPPRVRLLALAFALALLFVASSARAERRRVALVNGNALLDRSVTIALSPWDLDVLHVDWTSPGAGMPAAAVQAKAIAAVQHADAVAWISDDGGGRTLWVYDADTQQTVSRAIDGGAPNDDAAAAATALSIKTLLRASTVAPVHERIGAREEQRMKGAGLFRLEADGGARILSSDQGRLDLRIGLALAWWPRPFARIVGFALRAEAGTGVGIATSDFTGRLSDVVGSPAIRARLALGRRFAIEPSLGGSVHVTTLDGAAPLRGVPAHVQRVDPSIDGSLMLGFEIAGGVELGLRAGGAYLVRYQRYLLDGQSILSLSPLQLGAGLVLGAPLN